MSDLIANRVPSLQGIEIGVGTWAWGDQLFWGFGRGYQEKDLRSVFQQTLASGITFFDTAEVYGQGRSESYLGKFCQDFDIPVIIATKFFPFPWRLGKRSLHRALNGSLKRLHRATVDLYQIHWPFPPVTIETWMEAMAEVIHAGLVRSVGVSNYDRIQTQRAVDTLTRQGIPLASNQVEYSLLNRKIEKNGLLEYCNQAGIAVIAYSPLAQGLLSGKYAPENPPRGVRGQRYNQSLLKRIQPLVAALKRIGSDHAGKTAAQVALNWCICKNTIPIPGAKTVAQVEQNNGAVGWRLSENEIQTLDKLSDQAGEVK